MTWLSVVAPVHDEVAVVAELATRCLAAARQRDAEAEVILVDDASTDGTSDIGLPDGARFVHLPTNRGQLAATQAGLAAARGQVVVVLDGDLQDPPEHLVALVDALEADVTPVAFAVKRSRHDGLGFDLARAVYGAVQSVPGARPLPAGAGSFLAMRAPLAWRAAAADAGDANLAALVVGLGGHGPVVPYDKAARYDDTSRVGPAGLVREALGSFVLTGAATALVAWTGAAAGTALSSRGHRGAARGTWLATFLVAASVDATRRRRLRPREEDR